MSSACRTATFINLTTADMSYGGTRLKSTCLEIGLTVRSVLALGAVVVSVRQGTGHTPRGVALSQPVHSLRLIKVFITSTEAETRLNNIYALSPYRRENTALHRYKNQFVNAVQEIIAVNHVRPIHTNYKSYSFLKQVGIYIYQWALKRQTLKTAFTETTQIAVLALTSTTNE
jgi:hypothetical protein